MSEHRKPGGRVDALPPGHAPELKDQFDTFVRTLGFVPNSVLTMQHKPKLVLAFAQLQGALWDPESKVDRGFKRLVGHMASRTVGDPYSMAHTASAALHFGIAKEKLAAVAAYRTSALFSPAERAALDLAVAASSVPNAATDALFAELRTHWTDEQIIELVAVVAGTAFVNRWNTTLLTPLEAEPQAVAEEHLAPQGWSIGRHKAT